jgi:hypothetical protein
MVLETLAAETSHSAPELEFVKTQIEALRAKLSDDTLKAWDRARNGASIMPPHMRPCYQEQLLRVPNKDGTMVVATRENLDADEQARYQDAIAHNDPRLLIDRIFARAKGPA